ncbi:MAG TPA: DsbA family oxidoreductase [Solirubrobacteraceae bacterium]|nr:DsbA family oxidoreductase [Solirubrobacteraceae bacterium]
MFVEIWSDIACPWCYIGKRHFEAALGEFEHADEVEVIWRAYELDPSTPAEVEGSGPEILAKKYGMTLEQAQAAQERITQVAAEAGLDYHLDRSRMGSTFDGHRLVHLAGLHGLADAAKEQLFRARFVDGQLIADPDTLLGAAVEVGLEEGAVREMLASDRFAAEVRADEETARQLGITGVPMFVIDRQFGMSGAQPAESLLEFLRHGWAHRPAPVQAH